jgi:hypothetical protein
VVKSDIARIRVGESKLNKITSAAFSKTNPAALEKYRDLLYTSLADAEKLTWAKFVVFLSSFCVFYLLATQKTDAVTIFGLQVKDAAFLRKVYPFYIFYSFYQFFYSYVWSGIIQYQLDALNDVLLEETARAKLHYFTFPVNPHLFRNWAAQHLGLGVVTRDLFISASASVVRIVALLCLTSYVYFVNIRDYGVRSPLIILSLGFGIALFFRFLGIVNLYNGFIMRPLTKGVAESGAADGRGPTTPPSE